MSLRNQRRGAIIPLLAFVIIALLVIAALTINSSWLLYNQLNVQNAADLSARSSLVKIIEDTEFEGRIDRARDLGVRLYELNLDRPDAQFDPNSIRFGRIADLSASEPVLIATQNDAFPISAVQVVPPEEQSKREVKVFLSNFLGGRESVNISADATTSTRPIDIVLCLDASRSMNRTSQANNAFPPGGTTINEPPLPGSRWFELVDTVGLFLDAMQQVNPNARVGLVTFGGGANAQVLANAGGGIESDLDDDFARFEQELTVVISPQIANITNQLESYVTDNVALGLGTSLYDGIEVSVDAFESNSESSKHIIMLSDGNQAAVPRPAPSEAALAAADANIVIHTISFGGDFATMSGIATDTGGENFSALSEEELREAFSNLLGRFSISLVD